MESEFKTITSDTIVDYLSHIFEHSGAQEYLGEPVTMAQHMLQAASLAQHQGCSDEVIAAALYMTLAISPMILALFLWRTHTI